VLVDLPKDVLLAEARDTSRPQPRKRDDQAAPVDLTAIEHLAAAIAKAKRPLFYTGGGVINSGPLASALLRDLVDSTGIPITSTLMGLGAYPGSGKYWLGMLGLHGLYEANMATHHCDLLINIGARFDDRVTGDVKGFARNAIKAHIDIDPASINKIIKADIPIVGDVTAVLSALLRVWKAQGARVNAPALAAWWQRIEAWRKQDCLAFDQQGERILPQYALSRLQALTAKRNRYICTEVGQHQMWAAQHMRFDTPNRWMTSGGLGTMGYGFPASIGVQGAHPGALVINVAGDASWMMNMQEMGTAVQYQLPVKQFILNNARLGMVKQLQDVGYGGRHSQSWSESLPDFAKFAEAYGVKGIRCDRASELDDAIRDMVSHPGPAVLDCHVCEEANVYPMIRPGSSNSAMLMK
jgi:acetolactate synthase-1/2/3 large subunit